MHLAHFTHQMHTLAIFRIIYLIRILFIYIILIYFIYLYYFLYYIIFFVSYLYSYYHILFSNKTEWLQLTISLFQVFTDPYALIWRIHDKWSICFGTKMLWALFRYHFFSRASQSMAVLTEARFYPQKSIKVTSLFWLWWLSSQAIYLIPPCLACLMSRSLAFA